MAQSYQGYSSFIEMMADRPSQSEATRSIFDVKSDIEQDLTILGFQRTSYTPIFAEYKNTDGISIRLYSRGFTYEIYFSNGQRHSSGDMDSLSAMLKKRVSLRQN